MRGYDYNDTQRAEIWIAFDCSRENKNRETPRYRFGTNMVTVTRYKTIEYDVGVRRRYCYDGPSTIINIIISNYKRRNYNGKRRRDNYVRWFWWRDSR